MKLHHKIPLFVGIIGLVPAITISLIALTVATGIIKQNKFDQLISLREVKRFAVNHYLQQVQDETLSLARNPEVARAVEELAAAFTSYGQQTENPATTKSSSSLVNFYRTEFLPALNAQDPIVLYEAESLIDRMSGTARALQTAYIARNPLPTGEKDRLAQAPDGTRYDEAHALYHPYFSEFRQRFGFYDLFLINPQGDVIYTVFKEVDYATSLLDGPFDSSGLAEAFKRAAKLTTTDQAVLVDFQPYQPSYNAPAGFVAAPIFDKGRLVGVAALQFPIDSLNEIMAERQGLGESGETYLVGKDKLMRSDSYLDPDNHSVEASFRNPQVGRVDTEAVTAAARGESGVKVIIDYNNNPVLSAYAPLSFAGLDWSILAEIDEAEIMADIERLRLVIAIVLALAMVPITVIAWLMARSVIRPLGAEPEQMASIASQIAEGDLTMDLAVDHQSGAFRSIAVMATRLKQIVNSIASAAHQQASAAEELSLITTQSGEKLNVQQKHVEQAAAAINEMSASVADVARTTASAANASNEASVKLKDGSERVVDVAGEVQQVSSILAQAWQKVEELKAQSDNIASILESIRGIADQTNLLALNAAIEAARAGEQGRGFAVVADEVRSLAQNTQKSTGDISQMIHALQQGTSDACDVMRSSVDRMETVAERALATSSNLDEAVSSVGRIDDMMARIASAAEQQSRVVEDINVQITGINSMSSDSSEAAFQITAASEELAKLATNLQSLVGHFKTSR